MAHRIKRRMGERAIPAVLPVVMALMIAGLRVPAVGLAAFCLLNALEAVLFVAIHAYIHRIIPSAQRSTILSLESTLFSFVMILIFPLFGAIASRIGIPDAFLWEGALMVVLAIVNGALTLRHDRTRAAER